MTTKRSLFDFFVLMQFYKIIELTKKIFVQYETYMCIISLLRVEIQ
uniref:Uncharacterized protein n=1 Tax=Bartonella rochalimae ATCC BAA-1498 TaxID=685782 RepID=E6YKS3_9HYPH|nr:hypothetical protein BARRO_30042 [Bartonella rochalimae ATCC BAA-1498]